MTLRTEAGDKRHRQNARQIARADRLAGRQIALDDLAKNLARTLVELGEPQLVHADAESHGWPRIAPHSRRAIYHSAAAIARARRRRAQQIHELAHRAEIFQPVDRADDVGDMRVGQNALRHSCGISARSGARDSGFSDEPSGCSQRADSVVPSSIATSTLACEPVTAGIGADLDLFGGEACAASDRRNGRARTAPRSARGRAG